MTISAARRYDSGKVSAYRQVHAIGIFSIDDVGLSDNEVGFHCKPGSFDTKNSKQGLVIPSLVPSTTQVLIVSHGPSITKIVCHAPSTTLSANDKISQPKPPIEFVSIWQFKTRSNERQNRLANTHTRDVVTKNEATNLSTVVSEKCQTTSSGV